MRHCLYCDTPIDNIGDKKKFRKDKKYCNQQCHDKHKYQKESQSVKEFREQYGLYKYTLKGLEKKLKLIEMLGGKCERCGYNKNIAALDFHHKDGYDKNFEIKVQFLNYKSDDEILEEVLKCILLCSNCHRELHNPHLETDHVKRVLELR